LFISNLRYGNGKQNLEIKIIEEISSFTDAIREKNGKAFDINVSVV